MEVEEESGHGPLCRIWSTRIPSTSAVYGSGVADQRQDERQRGALIFFLLLSNLELNDTKVYEPEIRTLLGTASHFCAVVVLKSRTPGVADQRQDARQRVATGKFGPLLQATGKFRPIHTCIGVSAFINPPAN